jgi:hypothetical protein
VLPWRPATAFEQRLEEAHRTGDVAASLALLRNSELALPLPDVGAPAWATAAAGGLTWLLAYTSVEAMHAAGAGPRFRVASLPELAAGWPDPRWRLAVNAGLPVHVELESGTVARLAVQGLAENKAAYPDALPPVLQKVLTAREVAELARGGRRVSGYVHQLLDVLTAATPAELLETLGDQRDLLSPSGSLTVLRWTAVGSALYRTPYGGTDEERRAAVAGWVIEEPPFAGLGLGRNPDRVVREYKVDGVGLPAGAELWELGPDGEQQRAVLEAVRSPWWSYVVRRDATDHVVDLEAAGDRVEVVDAGGRRTAARDCAELAFVTTVCDWRGLPCVVLDEREGSLQVEYTGGRAPDARALGFDRVERGVHREWVPRAGVRGLRECRVPLDP